MENPRQGDRRNREWGRKTRKLGSDVRAWKDDSGYIGVVGAVDALDKCRTSIRRNYGLFDVGVFSFS